MSNKRRAVTATATAGAATASRPKRAKRGQAASTETPETDEVVEVNDDSAEVADLRARLEAAEKRLSAARPAGESSSVHVNLNMKPRTLKTLSGQSIEEFRVFTRDGSFTADGHLKFIDDQCAQMIDRYLRLNWSKLNPTFADKVLADSISPYSESNWRKWPASDLCDALLKLFPLGSTKSAALGPQEAIKDVEIRYNFADESMEQATIVEVQQIMANFSESDQRSESKMKYFVDTLKTKVKRFESQSGSLHTLWHFMSTLSPPTTVAAWLDNFTLAAAKTREFETLSALLQCSYNTKKKQSPLHGQQKQGGDSAVICTGCGIKYHTLDKCSKRDKPGFNPDPSKPWLETEVGKAYAKVGYTYLPNFSVEEAKKLGPPKNKKHRGKGNSHCPANCMCAIRAASSDAICVSVTIPPLVTQGAPKERSNLVDKAYLDTLCLAGDIVSDEFAEALVQRGYKKTPTTSRVCSGLDGTCETGLSLVTFPVMFVNELTNISEEMLIQAKVVSNPAFDFIIGLGTIKKYNLLMKLKSLIGDAAPSDPTQAPSRAAHGPVLVIPRGADTVNALIRSKEELLSSAPDADDEIDPELTDAAAPFLQKDTGDVLAGIKFGGSAQFQSTLRALCEEFRDIFSNEVGPVPAKVPQYKLELDLSKWKVPANTGPPRLQSAVKQQEIMTQISAMLAAGVIIKSTAVYYSHVQLAPKPGGAWRFCIDYRNLNAATVSDEAWPLPNIKHTLQRIGASGARVFGSVDMTSGYHQLALAACSSIFTAFIAFCGVYEFVRVPFGLKGAPSFFQKQMHSVVLHGLIYRICELYIDDCLIYGQNEDDFVTNLRQVFTRLREFGIKLKPKKCQLGFPEVDYVGFRLSSQGYSVIEQKAAKVTDFPQPLLHKQLKSFLGLINHFRDFIPQYGTLTHSLHSLVANYQPKHKIEWTDKAVDDFLRLKELLSKVPTLNFIDKSLPIYLHTDASDFGIGGYLFQLQKREDGTVRELPIAFLSKALTKTQLRWGTPQKEAYAVFACIKMLTHQLSDVKFRLRTDHKNLTYINMNSNPMIVRWKLALMEFDFDVEHISGEDNFIADAFSRLCDNNMTLPDYSIDDVICALVGESLTEEQYNAIRSVHNAVAGHEGVDRTFEKLRSQGYNWPYMRAHIKKYIRECPNCQLNSQQAFKVKQHPFSASTYQPMERLNFDFIGPFPDGGYLLVIIDTFTRWVELFITPDATALSAANALLEQFGRFGLPSQLLSDQGPHFVATVIKELTALIGIDHSLTIAYSKEENAIVERSNKEVNRHIRALCFDRRIINEYKQAKPFVQRIINAAYLGRTKIAPSHLLFGKMLDLDRQIFLPPAERAEVVNYDDLSEYMQTLIQVQDDLVETHRTLLAKTDESRLQAYNEGQTEYALGTYVLRLYPNGPPSRLSTRLQGPYKVLERRREGAAYLLQDVVSMKTKETSVHLLRPYNYDPTRDDPRQVANQQADMWDVEKILAHKGNTKFVTKLKFLVKWTGFDNEADNSWEPWAHLRTNVRLHEYMRTVGLANKIPKPFR
jgi:transposase InsO family protein